MRVKLAFRKLQKDNIFNQDFIDFKKNNEIEFKSLHQNCIAVLYAPNGTGKTSLAKVLQNGSISDAANKEGSFEVEFEGKTYTPDNNSLFYVINDQISRNIIKGNEKDYFLGANIQREILLRESIDNEKEKLFLGISGRLKKEFNIKKKGCRLIEQINEDKLKEYLMDFANSQSKGKGIDFEEFLTKLQNLTFKKISLDDEQLKKYNYIKENCIDSKDVICKVMDIGSSQVKKNESIREIEENDVALKLLKRFDYKAECIVCDNEDFDRQFLIEKKTSNKKRIIEELDDETKGILKNIIESVKRQDQDPLNIENTFLQAIKEGDNSLVIDLQDEINGYFEIFNIEINNFFATCLGDSNLLEDVKEYKVLLKSKPEITDDQMRLIQEFLNDHMDKAIELKRVDESRGSLKLKLDDKDIFGVEREDLHLSTGEQNFISLAFELIRASYLEKEIVILDDPMSSFDSIYKNKIAYCIIKFLEGKKQLILTHNTELIRLLQYQLKDCFNLYLLNNSDDGENGFIRINKKDQDILLNLDKLLKLFREDILAEIEDEKIFLVSMIPFMRGYANITGVSDSYTNLSKLMHGYETESIDIADIYNKLFRNGKAQEKMFKNACIISVEDILAIDIDNIKILKNTTNYQLLDKALYHTLHYLFLRLKVEKTLIEIYDIEVRNNMMLNNIIIKAFEINGDDSDEEKKEKEYNRIFFTSRKTLLNEFNHFEGNMNIFQPAIDISNCALKKEKKDILNKLHDLEEGIVRI